MPRQSDRQLVDAVKVSAEMIDMIPEPVNSHVPAGLAGANSSSNNASPLVWQLASEDDLSLEEVVVADLNFCNYVVGGPTSMFLKNTGFIVDLAGDVTVGVSSPVKLAGDVTISVSSPVDLAGNITVGVSFPADLAGGVTVGVAPWAVAEVASSVDIAEVAPTADLAEVVSSTDLAGDVPAGVASSAVTEVASSADIAEVVSSAVADLSRICWRCHRRCDFFGRPC